MEATVYDGICAENTERQLSFDCEDALERYQDIHPTPGFIDYDSLARVIIDVVSMDFAQPKEALELVLWCNVFHVIAADVMGEFNCVDQYTQELEGRVTKRLEELEYIA